MKTSITPGQKKQIVRVCEDAARKAAESAVEDAMLTRDIAQDILVSGNRLQEELKLVVGRFICRTSIVLREREDAEFTSGRLIDISDKVELLIRAGYHQVTNSGLGMPASAYRKLWPRTVIQPMEYVGRFDEELLVDRTIAKFEHVNRGNIYTWVNPADCTNLAPVVAASWYIAFVQLGKKNLGRPVEDCTKTFASDEVGLVTVEGLHLPVQHADYLRNYAVDLAGSRYGRWGACVVWFDHVRPNFCARRAARHPTMVRLSREYSHHCP